MHGHNNVRGAVIFPHNIGLGCTRSAALVERVTRATAEEVAATGLDWTFSPCIAVARDMRWGRTYESFGETPELVSEMAAAAVRGYQPTILACAKHYLADGGTAGGVDQGDARISEATLRAIHLPGYRAAVGAGVGSVMASFSSWNGQKMHGNRYLLTDVLKGELGFSGFVVSDWAAHRPASGRLRHRRRDLDQRRHRHGDGARPPRRVLQHAARGRAVRARAASRASTTPSGASCARRSRSTSSRSRSPTAR